MQSHGIHTQTKETSQKRLQTPAAEPDPRHDRDLLVLILSLVLVIRRHGEDTPPDAPGTTAASETSTKPVSDPVPESSTPGTEGTDPAKGEIHMRDSQITLTVGESRRLQATDASDAAAKAVWSSSDSRIAAVSADGAVTAVAPGSCTITATLSADSTVFGNVTVTVVPAQTESPENSDEIGTTEPIPAKTEPPAAQADPTEPTYIQGILIANKTYALPKPSIRGWIRRRRQCLTRCRRRRHRRD